MERGARNNEAIILIMRHHAIILSGGYALGLTRQNWKARERGTLQHTSRQSA